MEHRKWKLSEFETTSSRRYDNPFWDVQVRAEFRHEDGKTLQTANAFYDGLNEEGHNRWKLRWTPTLEGAWHCRIYAVPANKELEQAFQLVAEAPEPGSKGFLRADPTAKYGFAFDNGEPFFLLGDTLYNLFGAAYCEVDVESVLRKRRSQGINYVRSRLQVSPYHPEMRNQWQTKDCWPWGGSSQWPDFMRLNLAYFESVDRVIALASELGMGFEMILQGWLIEFPFNDRGRFIAEYEAFWHEYIIARYAAYDSVYIWCPANEYEYYPLGQAVKYNKESNRWIIRLSEQIRALDPFAHPIGAHNWEQKVSLDERLGHCDTIDVYLVQINWVAQIFGDRVPASLCKLIEKDLKHHAGTRTKSVVCAEFGYEKSEGLLTVSVHLQVDHHHTRRGQWRAGFSGFPIVHGFDNTWGPHIRLDKEPPGTDYLLPYYRFMTETVSFDKLSPSPERIVAATGSEDAGSLPLCLSDRESGVSVVYFPVKGSCELLAEDTLDAAYRWYNPRTGILGESERCSGATFVTPDSEADGGGEYEDDWVLLIERSIAKGV